MQQPEETIQEPVDQSPPPSLEAADLVVLIKFLANLNETRRLSDLEIHGIKPSFDKVSAFLMEQERLIAEQQRLVEEERLHYENLRALGAAQEAERIAKEAVRDQENLKKAKPKQKKTPIKKKA